MMRKISFFLVTAALCALAALAAAEAPDCPKHPEARTVIERVHCLPNNSRSHATYEDHYCAVCGEYIDKVMAAVYEPHAFEDAEADGAACTVCQYTKPTRAANAERANSFLKDLDTRSAHVVYSAAVCTAPGGKETGNTLPIGSVCRIVAHKTVDDALWCRIADVADPDSPDGWVPAENLDVIDATYKSKDVIGRKCIITAGSTRTREDAGESPAVSPLRRGDFLMIYDVEQAVDGRWWFCVSREGNEWILAGMAEPR